MATVPKKAVENMFAYFVKAIGGKLAEGYNDVGGYALDYTLAYGGYKIVQISGKSGGQSEPFGSMRRKPQEFVDTLRFATYAIEESKRNKKR